MDQRDLALINELVRSNETLHKLMSEHEVYEQQLSRFNRLPYLTPAEEVERKRIQKLKLRGRDRIERILADIRRARTTSARA